MALALGKDKNGIVLGKNLGFYIHCLKALIVKVIRCVMIALIYSCCLYYRIARLINLLNSFKDHFNNLDMHTCIPYLSIAFLNTLRDKGSVSMGNSWRVIIVLSDLLELIGTEGSRRVDSMRSGLSLSKVLSALR